MEAVICGAGIAGLSLAQRLITIGWDVVVLSIMRPDLELALRE